MMRGGGVSGGARRPHRRTAPFPLERALVLAFVACVVGGYMFLYINIQRAMNQEARHKAEVVRTARAREETSTRSLRGPRADVPGSRPQIEIIIDGLRNLHMLDRTAARA